MIKIPKDKIEEARNYPMIKLLQRIGIEVIGKYFRCINPDHKDKTPSMSIKYNKFKCFGCDWHGDTIELVMKVLGLSFREAVEFILNEKITQHTILCQKPLNEPLKCFESKIKENGEKYSDIYEYFINLLRFPNEDHYLAADRKIDIEILKKNNIRLIPKKDKYGNFYKDLLKKHSNQEQLINAGLLYAKGYQNFYFKDCDYIVPFYKNDKIYYLQGGKEKGMPKCKNLPSRILKPLLFLPKIFSEYPKEQQIKIWLHEGAIDCLSSLTRNGRAASIIDANLHGSIEELDLLKSFSILLALDADKAGEIASLKIQDYFNKNQFTFEEINMLDCAREVLNDQTVIVKDMNELLKEESTRRIIS